MLPCQTVGRVFKKGGQYIPSLQLWESTSLLQNILSNKLWNVCGHMYMFHNDNISSIFTLIITSYHILIYNDNKKLMRIGWILSCVMVGCSIKLITSSTMVEQIKINGTSPIIFDEQVHPGKYDFPFGEPFSISTSTQREPNGYVFVVQHLFGMDCSSPLFIYLVADDWATIYMNRQYVCNRSGHATFNNCSISEEMIGSGCNERNLTIVVKNEGGPTAVTYQVVQAEEKQCKGQDCPKPLTWYGYPACACSCGYTSFCARFQMEWTAFNLCLYPFETKEMISVFTKFSYYHLLITKLYCGVFAMQNTFERYLKGNASSSFLLQMTAVCSE